MSLSTHVLDTMHGTPAAGMTVALYEINGESVTLLRQVVLNQDGRNPEGLLLAGDAFQRGCYRLVFDVAGYFASRGVALPQPNFLGKVQIDFGIAEPAQHYHVPLLVSPWSYSTYRGS